MSAWVDDYINEERRRINISGFFNDTEFAYVCDLCHRKMLPYETKEGYMNEKTQHMYICGGCGQKTDYIEDD